MNGDVAEINVQQLRLLLSRMPINAPFPIAKSARERREFAGTKTAGENVSPASDHVTASNGKRFRFLPLLRDHDGPDPLERGDLPVDVKHLRLQKGRAIARNHRRWTQSPQRLKSSTQRRHQAQTYSKIHAEERSISPSICRGSCGIVGDDCGPAPFRIRARRARIEQLHRIAVAERARKHARWLYRCERRGRRPFHSVFAVFRASWSC